MAIGVALVMVAGALHFADCDESRNTLVEDMAVSMLETLPENALILSAQWDFWVSGSWYLQAVEGMRPDVTVIDQELLRRSWYLDQVGRAHPELMGKIRHEEEIFREHLYKFEHGLPYDAGAIGKAYSGLIDAMIEENFGERPVLVTGEVDPRYGARFGRVPYYLALRLVSDEAYLPQGFPDYPYKPLEGRLSVYTAKLAELYASSNYARGLYELHHGNHSVAERYLEVARSFDPGYGIEDIPRQPLDGAERIAASLGWFEKLRLSDPR
jgi:hypothetical protein